MVDGTSYDVEPGGVVVFPAGMSASFGVVGDSARFIAVTTGDGAGRFFADFADSVPAGQPVEDAMEAILSVTRRHSVAVADSGGGSAPGPAGAAGRNLPSGVVRP